MKPVFGLALVLIFFAPVAAQIKPGILQGASAPTFSAVAMDGTMIDTASLRGKVVVINLWFVNCPNCVQEIRSLNQLVDQYSNNKDIVFVGLATNRKSDIEKFLAKNPFKYVIVPNATQVILTKFGTPDENGDIVVAFPMHYILDRNGNILLKSQGIKGVDAIKKELEDQFSTKPAPAK